jgi:hypothetical protein
MSLVGNRNSVAWPDRPDHRGLTLLKGHSLHREGHQVFNEVGLELTPAQRTPGRPLYGKCQCGELFGPGLTRNAVKRAHAAHKDEIRQKESTLNEESQRAVDSAFKAVREACAVEFYDTRMRYVNVQMDMEMAVALGLQVEVDGEWRTIADLEKEHGR